MSCQITSKRTGFTLLELLVVIAIIGLLASIITVSVNLARIKARDAKRIADFKQIQNALALYYDDNGKYPIYWGPDIRSSFSDTNWIPELQQYFPGGKIPTNPDVASSNACWTALNPPGSTPQEICRNEPLQTCPGRMWYHYTTSQNGSNYLLYTFLENRKNPNVNWCTGKDPPCDIGVWHGWGSNYIVHGPDYIDVEGDSGAPDIKGRLPCDT